MTSSLTISRTWHVALAITVKLLGIVGNCITGALRLYYECIAYIEHRATRLAVLRSLSDLPSLRRVNHYVGVGRVIISRQDRARRPPRFDEYDRPGMSFSLASYALADMLAAWHGRSNLWLPCAVGPLIFEELVRRL